MKRKRLNREKGMGWGFEAYPYYQMYILTLAIKFQFYMASLTEYTQKKTGT